ncbi:hypothetical protein NL108_013719, partial [Boleophthalmus pectinirostris]
VLPPLYLALCIVGLLLNAVASFVFCRVPSDAALVVYLKNMLLADLLMLIYFPFKLLAQLGVGGWRLHVIMCSFGRVSVVHFLQSPGSAFTVAVGTWGLMLLSTLPNVLLTSRDANETNARRCMDLKTELGVRWHKASSIFSVGVFWLTLVVMVTCYTSIGVHVYRSCRRVRSNSSVCRKSRRSILSLLLVFALCFVPYHLCRIPYTLSQMPWSGFSQHSRFVLFQVKEATLMLASVNVCLDPLVYFLMCRSFRHTLLQSLRRRAKPAGEARSMGTSTAVVLFNV